MPKLCINVQFLPACDSYKAKENTYRILIADDHAVARHGLMAALASVTDIEVCGEALTGLEAVRLATQLKPDLVILDLSLRELNGVEVVRAIRTTLHETEVLVVSLHDSLDVVSIALRAGARGYVTKSDSHEELISAVQSVRNQEPHVSTRLVAKMRGKTRRLLRRNASPDRTLTPERIESVLTLAEFRLEREVREMVRSPQQ
jgi:DNA-binding NarL/FixJ family response regulator